MEKLLESLAAQTELWITDQRSQFIPHARPISAAHREALAAHVDEALLSRARVARVAAFFNPPFFEDALAALRANNIHTSFDLRGANGVTFDDCILVRGGPSPRLLLHELVHVAQYVRLGIRGFARGYLFALANAGFVYENNAFESIAFTLEHRYAAREAFDVQQEVDAWLDRLRSVVPV